MPKFKVQITETLQRIVEVEATDEEVAVDIITDQYKAEEIVLDADDYQNMEIEVVE